MNSNRRKISNPRRKIRKGKRERSQKCRKKLNQRQAIGKISLRR